MKFIFFQNNFLLNKKNLILFLLFSLISLNNCLIEIPLKAVKVKGVAKYDIKVKEIEEDYEINNMNKTILANKEGDTSLNGNQLFLANVKIGSKDQSFNLVLDTGSYILWVAQVGSEDQHQINHHYDPTGTPSKDSFEQKYGTGYCTGRYYTDNFKYINDKKFKVKFGVATETVLDVDNGDGIIGLAHDYDDENLSFIHMLKKGKVTDSKAFSIKIEGSKGKLIIGKHKDFSSDDAVTCPLLRFIGQGNIFWGGQMTAFGMENSKHSEETKKTYTVIFDTGTNFIILPKKYYLNLQKNFGKFGCSGTTEDSKSYQLKCSKDNRVDFKLTINTHVFIIPKEAVFQLHSDKFYYSRVVFADDLFVEGAYIIGNPFFLIFHTLFDKDKEKLHFYPIDPQYLIKGSGESGGSGDSSSIFAIVVVLIFVIGLLGFIAYKFIQWRLLKRNDIPSSDYYGNNTNFI